MTLLTDHVYRNLFLLSDDTGYQKRVTGNIPYSSWAAVYLGYEPSEIDFSGKPYNSRFMVPNNS